MGLVFVLGTIASKGLSLTIDQITGPLRELRFVVVGLLANFAVPPIWPCSLSGSSIWMSLWPLVCQRCLKRLCLPKWIPPQPRA